VPVQQPGAPQPGIPYDFNAADNLETTLKSAGGLLQNLLANRGKWVSQYLTYKDNGPQQGWVGTEYKRWAAQFNESQFMLGKYVNQLYGRAVDVHNTSYNAYITSFTAGGTPFDQNWTGSRHPYSYMTYASPQGWSGAPTNSAAPGTEGATPQCLYNYSDSATKANDENLRSFFTKNLAAAAAAAPVADTAWSKGGNPPASALARAIAWFLRWQVLELDARVRIVGEAFELAGNRQSPGYFTFQTPDQLDKTINSELPSIQAANKLAQQVNQQGVTPDVLKRLQEYENDPAFMATFFNDLTPDQINELLSGYGVQLPGAPKSNPDWPGMLDQALVSAFASGALSPATVQQIIRYMPPDQLLPALASNPKAALNFVESLTPDEINKMATYMPGTATSSIQPDFIAVYAAAIKAAPDSNTAQYLFNQITQAVTTEPVGMTWNPGTLDAAAIGQLIAAMAAWKLPKVPAGADQQGLQQWAGEVGGTFDGLLNQWLPWLKTTEGANEQVNANIQDVVSTLVGMAIAEVAVDTGFDAAAWSIAAGLIQSDLTEAITSIMTSPTEDPQTIQDNLKKATTSMAETLAITRLLQEGVIYTGEPGQEGSQPLQPNQQNLNAILNAFKSKNANQQWSIRTPGEKDQTTFSFLAEIYYYMNS
jgi:hypothetical protein